MTAGAVSVKTFIETSVNYDILRKRFDIHIVTESEPYDFIVPEIYTAMHSSARLTLS